MEKLNDLEAKKRLDIVISARIKGNKNIKKSIEIQDNLSRKSGSWSGEDEILKWRKQH